MNNLKANALFCIPCISFLLLVSWFFAVTMEHLSGHHHFRPSLFGKKESDLKKLTNRESNQMQIKDTFENIFTFVQVLLLVLDLAKGINMHCICSSHAEHTRLRL